MDFKQRECFFLTSCYSNKVNEELVFKYFILKYIVDTVQHSETNLNIQKKISSKYGILIPLSLVDSCLRQICEEHDALSFENDNLTVKKALFSLEHELDKFTSQFDKTIEEIKSKFNLFLESNKIEPIKTKKLIDCFNTINVFILENNLQNQINIKVDKIEKLLLEFIYFTYRANSDSTLITCLNKLLYTVLVFVYFSSINYRNEKIQGRTYIFDTNILIYLLGINGKSRQIYILELLEFIKKYDCSIIISIESLSELSNLLSKEKNEEIQFFKHHNPQLAYNITHYPEDAIKNILKEYKLIIDESSKADNKKKFPEWDDLLFSLDRYKSEKRGNRMFYEDSIDHDINLIYLGELYLKVKSFYDVKYPLITADYQLVNWFIKEIKSKFNSEMSGIISLDKIILLLWIEGESFNQTEFIANSWSYVVENIPYFKMESTNSIFRLFEDEIAEENKNILVQDWRSALLIVEKTFKDPSSINKATRENIIEAIKLFKNDQFDKIKKENLDLEARLDNLESIVANSNTDTEKKSMELLEAKVEFIRLQNESKDALAFKESFEKQPFKIFIQYLTDKYWFLEFLKYFLK